METVQNRNAVREEIRDFIQIILVGIADDAFYFFSFIKRDRKKIVLKCVHPAVVNDVDDFSRNKVLNDKCIFLIMTDIETHFINRDIFRKWKSREIDISGENIMNS